MSTFWANLKKRKASSNASVTKESEGCKTPSGAPSGRSSVSREWKDDSHELESRSEGPSSVSREWKDDSHELESRSEGPSFIIDGTDSMDEEDKPSDKGCFGSSRRKGPVLPRSGFRSMHLPSTFPKGFWTGSLPRHLHRTPNEAKTPAPTTEPESPKPPKPTSSPRLLLRGLRNKRAASASPSRDEGAGEGRKKFFKTISTEKLPASLRKFIRARQETKFITTKKVPMKPSRRTGPVGRNWIKVYDDIIYIDDTLSAEIIPLGDKGYPTVIPDADPLPVAPTPPPEKPKRDVLNVSAEEVPRAAPKRRKKLDKAKKAETVEMENKENISENERINEGTEKETEQINEGFEKETEVAEKQITHVTRPGRSRDVSRYKGKRQKRSGTPIGRSTSPILDDEDEQTQGRETEEVIEDGYIIPQLLKPPRPPRGNKIYETVGKDKPNEKEENVEALSTTEQVVDPPKPKRGVNIYESIVFHLKEKDDMRDKSLEDGEDHLEKKKDVPPKPKRGIKIYETIQIGFRVKQDKEPTPARENITGENDETVCDRSIDTETETQTTQQRTENELKQIEHETEDAVDENLPPRGESLPPKPARGNKIYSNLTSEPLDRANVSDETRLEEEDPEKVSLNITECSNASGTQTEVEVSPLPPPGTSNEAVAEIAGNIVDCSNASGTQTEVKVSPLPTVGTSNEAVSEIAGNIAECSNASGTQTGVKVSTLPPTDTNDNIVAPPIPPKKRKLKSPEDFSVSDSHYDVLPCRPPRNLKPRAASLEASPTVQKRQKTYQSDENNADASSKPSKSNQFDNVVLAEGKRASTLPRQRSKKGNKTPSVHDKENILPTQPLRHSQNRQLPAPPRRKKVDKAVTECQAILSPSDGYIDVKIETKDTEIPSEPNIDKPVPAVTQMLLSERDKTPPPTPPKKKKTKNTDDTNLTSISKNYEKENEEKENGANSAQGKRESDETLYTTPTRSITLAVSGECNSPVIGSKLDVEIDDNLKRLDSSFETIDTVIQSLKKYASKSRLDDSSDNLRLKESENIYKTDSENKCDTSEISVLKPSDSVLKPSDLYPDQENICGVSIDSETNSDADTVISVEKDFHNLSENQSVDNNITSEVKPRPISLLEYESVDTVDEIEATPLEVSFVIKSDEPLQLPSLEELLSKHDAKEDQLISTEIPLNLTTIETAKFEFKPFLSNEDTDEKPVVCTEIPVKLSVTDTTYFNLSSDSETDACESDVSTGITTICKTDNELGLQSDKPDCVLSVSAPVSHLKTDTVELKSETEPEPCILPTDAPVSQLKRDTVELKTETDIKPCVLAADAPIISLATEPKPECVVQHPQTFSTRSKPDIEEAQASADVLTDVSSSLQKSEENLECKGSTSCTPKVSTEVPLKLVTTETVNFKFEPETEVKSEETESVNLKFEFEKEVKSEETETVNLKFEPEIEVKGEETETVNFKFELETEVKSEETESVSLKFEPETEVKSEESSPQSSSTVSSHSETESVSKKLDSIIVSKDLVNKAELGTSSEDKESLDRDKESAEHLSEQELGIKNTVETDVKVNLEATPKKEETKPVVTTEVPINLSTSETTEFKFEAEVPETEEEKTVTGTEVKEVSQETRETKETEPVVTTEVPIKLSTSETSEFKFETEAPKTEEKKTVTGTEIKEVSQETEETKVTESVVTTEVPIKVSTSETSQFKFEAEVPETEEKKTVTGTKGKEAPEELKGTEPVVSTEVPIKLATSETSEFNFEAEVPETEEKKTVTGTEVKEAPEEFKGTEPVVTTEVPIKLSTSETSEFKFEAEAPETEEKKTVTGTEVKEVSQETIEAEPVLPLDAEQLKVETSQVIIKSQVGLESEDSCSSLTCAGVVDVPGKEPSEQKLESSFASNVEKTASLDYSTKKDSVTEATEETKFGFEETISPEAAINVSIPESEVKLDSKVTTDRGDNKSGITTDVPKLITSEIADIKLEPEDCVESGNIKSLVSTEIPLKLASTEATEFRLPPTPEASTDNEDTKSVVSTEIPLNLATTETTQFKLEPTPEASTENDDTKYAVSTEIPLKLATIETTELKLEPTPQASSENEDTKSAVSTEIPVKLATTETTEFKLEPTPEASTENEDTKSAVSTEIPLKLPTTETTEFKLDPTPEASNENECAKSAVGLSTEIPVNFTTTETTELRLKPTSIASTTNEDTKSEVSTEIPLKLPTTETTELRLEPTPEAITENEDSKFVVSTEIPLKLATTESTELKLEPTPEPSTGTKNEDTKFAVSTEIPLKLSTTETTEFKLEPTPEACTENEETKAAVSTEIPLKLHTTETTEFRLESTPKEEIENAQSPVTIPNKLVQSVSESAESNRQTERKLESEENKLLASESTVEAIERELGSEVRVDSEEFNLLVSSDGTKETLAEITEDLRSEESTTQDCTKAEVGAEVTTVNKESSPVVETEVPIKVHSLEIAEHKLLPASEGREAVLCAEIPLELTAVDTTDIKLQVEDKTERELTKAEISVIVQTSPDVILDSEKHHSQVDNKSVLQLITTDPIDVELESNAKVKSEDSDFSVLPGSSESQLKPEIQVEVGVKAGSEVVAATDIPLKISETENVKPALEEAPTKEEINLEIASEEPVELTSSKATDFNPNFVEQVKEELEKENKCDLSESNLIPTATETAYIDEESTISHPEKSSTSIETPVQVSLPETNKLIFEPEPTTESEDSNSVVSTEIPIKFSSTETAEFVLKPDISTHSDDYKSQVSTEGVFKVVTTETSPTKQVFTVDTNSENLQSSVSQAGTRSLPEIESQQAEAKSSLGLRSGKTTSVEASGDQEELKNNPTATPPISEESNLKRVPLAVGTEPVSEKTGISDLANRLEGIRSQLDAIISNYPTSNSSSVNSFDTALSNQSNRSSASLDYNTALDSPLSFASFYSPNSEFSHSIASLCSTPCTFYTADTASEASFLTDSGTDTRTPSPSSDSSSIKGDRMPSGEES